MLNNGSIRLVIALLNFPLPYSDELLYSTIARAGIRQGYTSPKQLLEDVFGSRSVIATVDLPNHLELVSRWLPHEFAPEKLNYNHTLFPLYAPFIVESRRLECVNRLNAARFVHTALGVSASRIKSPRFIRYCPCCLIDQRERSGEYYWLREWQVAGIESCPEHGVLIDTNIARPLVDRHRFIAAAPENCALIKQRSGTEMSVWVSAQVRQLLAVPVQTSPSYDQWTGYYQRLAMKLGLCRGKYKIDYSLIRQKVLNVWPENWLIRNNLMPISVGAEESDWLKAIFRKHRRSFNYLQHIVVLQALLPSDWEISKIINEVKSFGVNKKLNKVGAITVNTKTQTPDQEEWLKLLLAHSPKQARHASAGLYLRLYRKHRDWLLLVNSVHSDRSSVVSKQRVDWNKRDREILQSIVQLSAFLKANPHGPRRSRNYYLKLLGRPSMVQNLYRMPRCDKYFSLHAEGIQEYQVRRLKNTYEEMRNMYESPPRATLLRKAGLSDKRLKKKARQYLEKILGAELEFQGRRR